jgi:hypothetical protein
MGGGEDDFAEGMRGAGDVFGGCVLGVEGLKVGGGGVMVEKSGLVVSVISGMLPVASVAPRANYLSYWCPITW